MKKLLTFTLAITLCLSLVACGGGDSSSVGTGSSAVQTGSSVAQKDEDAYLGYTFEIEIPEGLEPVEEMPEGVEKYWQAEDGSNINMVAVENDGSLASEVSGDQMRQVLEQSYISQLDGDAEMNDFKFESTDIDGCPAYRMSFSLSYDGAIINQSTVGVNGDKAYTFTCTDMTGGNWTEQFENALNSIKAVPVA